jgi:peroxiredoxin
VYEKYRGKGLAFLSVNVSWDKDGPARKFVDDFRLPFPVGRDSDGRLGNLYGVEATPTSLFIGKDGVLVERQEGGLEEAYFEHRIERLLSS